VRTDTNLYVEGHAVIKVKITEDTVKKYSRPGDQAPGICAALAKMMGKYIAGELSKDVQTSLPEVDKGKDSPITGPGGPMG
jgi:hypothetical protein